MPANITDVDEFTAPIVRVADGDPGQASSLTPTTQGLANRTRNLANRLGGDDGSGEWLYRDDAGADAPKTRVIKVGPFVGHDASVNADTALGWSGVTATMGAGVTTSSLVSRENSADWLIELGAAVGGIVIPHGAIVTKIRVLVDPGAARSTGSERMALYFYEAAYDLDSPALSSGTKHVDAVTDDGTSNLQTISSGTISVTIDRAKRYYVRVIAGVDAGSNNDRIHVFEITFTDPGPRNA